MLKKLNCLPIVLNLASNYIRPKIYATIEELVKKRKKKTRKNVYNIIHCIVRKG